MASLPATSRCLCRNSFYTITRFSKSTRGTILPTQRRNISSHSTDSAHPPNFHVAYGKLNKNNSRNTPPIHIPVERRRENLGEQGLAIHGIKRPSFPRFYTGSETTGFDFLELSDLTMDEKAHQPVEIWYPEQPMYHARLHYGNLQDWNQYWETIPPTISQKTQAQHFFTKKASPKFLQSVAYFRAFPESDVPEVAFVGRSNVGKSSLLNAIVNADTKALLARTSSTPGFTKTMNLYGLGPQGGVHYKMQPSGHGKIVGTGGITIVDMPGYGEGSLSQWGVEIMKYLQGRKQLRRVFLLIDAEHGIKDKDRSLLSSLRLGGIPHQIILSKLDKIYLPDARSIKRFDGKRLDKLRPKGTLEELHKTMDQLRTEIQLPVGGSALGEILACSSEIVVDERRLGIDAVRFAMLRAIGFPFRTDQSAIERVHKQGPTLRTLTNNVPVPLEIRKIRSDKLDQAEAFREVELKEASLKEASLKEASLKEASTTDMTNLDGMALLEATVSSMERRNHRRSGRR